MKFGSCPLQFSCPMLCCLHWIIPKWCQSELTTFVGKHIYDDCSSVHQLRLGAESVFSCMCAACLLCGSLLLIQVCRSKYVNPIQLSRLCVVWPLIYLCYLFPHFFSSTFYRMVETIISPYYFWLFLALNTVTKKSLEFGI